MSTHSGQSEDPGLPAAEIREEETLTYLWDMIDDFAPHLRHSFIRMRAWWGRYGGSPQAHVSL